MSDAVVVSILNLLSGAVALLISYYAYKSNKLVGSILLRYISVGFLVLGISLLLQAGTELLVNVTPLDVIKVHRRALEVAAFLVYTTLQLVAYAIFAWGYGLSAYAHTRATGDTKATVPAATATLLAKGVGYAAFVFAVYIVSQAGIVVLLLLIVIHGVRVFSQSKSNLALMVLFGFSLIFLGHILMLGGALAALGSVYLVGNSIELCGFIALLFFLIWSGRVVR